MKKVTFKNLNNIAKPTGKFSLKRCNVTLARNSHQTSKISPDQMYFELDYPIFIKPNEKKDLQ